MFKGTGKPIPLKQVLVLFSNIGRKLKQPPDPIKSLHDRNEAIWHQVKKER